MGLAACGHNMQQRAGAIAGVGAVVNEADKPKE